MMNRRHLVLALLIVPCLAGLLTMPAHGDEPGYEVIFDGKTLDGWDGNPKFWSVKDGAITGQTTPENPTKGNTWTAKAKSCFHFLKVVVDGRTVEVEAINRSGKVFDTWSKTK